MTDPSTPAAPLIARLEAMFSTCCFCDTEVACEKDLECAVKRVARHNAALRARAGDNDHG